MSLFSAIGIGKNGGLFNNAAASLTNIVGGVTGMVGGIFNSTALTGLTTHPDLGNIVGGIGSAVSGVPSFPGGSMQPTNEAPKSNLWDTNVTNNDDTKSSKNMIIAGVLLFVGILVALYFALTGKKS